MRRRLKLSTSVGPGYAGNRTDYLELHLRDGQEALICPWCERQMTVPKRGDLERLTDETREHIVPKLEGGTDKLDNLVLACRECNAKRGGHVLNRNKRVR